MRTIAALYVDPRGPYPTMPDVECWDEARDAKTYPGPHPVVAHPPCGPWSRLKHFCKHQDRECAVVAVEQVRRWGGVLEHPIGSGLFRLYGLPLPGGLPDIHGGWSVELNQVSYGHVTRKPTVIYVVGVRPSTVAIRRGGVPTHSICNGRGQALKDGTVRKRCTAADARRTPIEFAEFLVGIARLAA